MAEDCTSQYQPIDLHLGATVDWMRRKVVKHMALAVHEQNQEGPFHTSAAGLRMAIDRL